MKRSLIALALIGSSTLAACGSKTDAGSDSTGSAAETPDASAAPATGGLSADITLTGGSHAGAYKAEKGTTPCLDYGPLGLGGMYGAAIEDTASALRRVEFGISTKATAPTDDFSMSISIKDPAFRGDYRLEPKKGMGTGTATLSGTAPEYTVKVSGKTPEGVGVEATFRCVK